MGYQRITNLLDNTSDKVSRFITKIWIEFHDQSGETYDTNKQIRFKTSILRSDLCDYSDAYIAVKGDITVEGENKRDKKNRPLTFKNNAPFISCISRINSVLTENAEDLDIVIPMCNLLEYSKNYSKTFGSLWNCYRDELTDEASYDNGSNKNVINSKSFKYKTSIKRNTFNVAATAEDYDVKKEGTKKVSIPVPLKHLSNFWKTIDIPLINCKLSLALSWSASFVITSLEKRLVTPAQGGNPADYDDSPTNATFKIKDTKLYVLVVTLSAKNDNKLLQ